MAIYHQTIFLVRNFAFEAAMGRIMPQQVCQVISRNQVVDGDELNLRIVNAGAKNQTADAAKTVNSDTNLCHLSITPYKPLARRCPTWTRTGGEYQSSEF